jgi:hypothetical protein
MFLMAGPLSSEEIEDVVSSVRRLVSNEQSGRRVTRDLNAERLLLTSALRVVSEIGPLSPLVLNTQVPEPEIAPSQGPTVAPPDPEVADLPETGREPGAEIDLIEADWEEELWSAPESPSLGEVALGAEEAEILTSPEASAEVEVAAGPEDDQEAWDQIGADLVADEPIPFIPLRRRAENLAARLAAGDVMEPSLQGSAAPFGASRNAAAEDVEADEPLLDQDVAIADPGTAGYPPTDRDSAMAEPDHGEDEARIGATQRMPTEILDADGTPLAVLDEAALQEIVRQMIREELQGSLGERITRNVRKLVRAEINRALVARDLD